ncbi:Cytochrome P450 monooxygenase rdc4 [Lasiodiplodia theobromae]|uniref:Cytochrome P450 monooxygenase rdc4 n=2 Tax=Lasiodiplodia theobromae TaxID=45133 RepID=A0A5N5D1Q9_9PEZI|nr:Cytochrome P450 monooxygenase rdc4 [Lasiodiplodia theobromae]
MCATAIGAVTYNVFFHPLARFPGPRFAATTRLVKHFKAIQGVQHQWIKEQHDIYGPVVRIGPNILSYTNPEAQKDVCGHRTATHKANLKDFTFFAKEVNGVPSLVSIEDHEEHGRVRRIFSNAFSDKALKEQEPLIRKYADKLVASLTNQVAAGKAPDIVKMYNCATFDVMGDLCFGQSLGLLEDSEYSPWVKAIFEGFKALQLAGASRDYPFFAPLLDLLIPRSLQKKRQDHFQYSADRVNKRLNTNTDRPDIWTLVLRHQEKGNGLSMAQMHSNASLFMVAGTETTATLLSGLTDLLLKHPDKLAILTAEIRNSVTTTDELTINNLQRLTYLQACLTEGLRLYPPTPLGSPRIVPEGGNVICNEFLPAGTNICVNYWAAFRCADNFYRPEAFLPERWLPEPPHEFANDKRDVMQPFSVGPYACLGKNLAYHEMRLILAKVLYNFDLVPYVANESKMDRDWSDHKVFGLWEKPPLPVKLVKRS